MAVSTSKPVADISAPKSTAAPVLDGANDPSTPKEAVVACETVVKRFELGQSDYQALRGITIEIFPEDFTIINGPSGCGKSTLLNILIGLERPTNGKVWFASERIDVMTEDERAVLRSQRLGIVYQQPVWIKSLSVLENVAMPLLIRGVRGTEASKKAQDSLSAVDMLGFAFHKPTEISGGQQQRVSLARALINDPDVLILDEPTGNLDTQGADQVMQLLISLNTEHQRTIIMVTHNLDYLPLANRVIAMRDGLIEKVTEQEKQTLFSSVRSLNAS